jgi:hypothetical protein
MIRLDQGLSSMRTTLDIDEDVHLAAKEHAAIGHKSLGAVISELAREALQRRTQSAVHRKSVHQGGRFAVLPQRDEVITVEHVRRLLHDLSPRT